MARILFRIHFHNPLPPFFSRHMIRPYWIIEEETRRLGHRFGRIRVIRENVYKIKVSRIKYRGRGGEEDDNNNNKKKEKEAEAWRGRICSLNGGQKRAVEDDGNFLGGKDSSQF